jgi:hypothetical protein
LLPLLSASPLYLLSKYECPAGPGSQFEYHKLATVSLQATQVCFTFATSPMSAKMRAYPHNQSSKEADRTLLMLVLHFMNESKFTGDRWQIIASVTSEQEGKHYSNGRCWWALAGPLLLSIMAMADLILISTSWYRSPMFEARRRLLPNPKQETEEPDPTLEFEGNLDFESSSS